MKFVRLAILSFVLLFTVVFLISLLIPSRVRMSRATNIRAPKDSLMTRLRVPERWREWYPGLDSAALITGEKGTKGVRMRNAKGGEATLTISTIDSNTVSSVFAVPNMPPVINVWNVIGHPHSDSLTLHWYMDIRLRWYPWEKFASLLLEKSYGPQMETGLGNLKTQLEE